MLQEILRCHLIDIGPPSCRLSKPQSFYYCFSLVFDLDELDLLILKIDMVQSTQQFAFLKFELVK